MDIFWCFCSEIIVFSILVIFYTFVFVVQKKRAKTMMCDIRKLLEACLTWSHGYGESHAENLLKSKDERCFMLPKCGSHMTGQGG